MRSPSSSAPPPLVGIERAAARYFGIRTYAVHVNGLVRSGGDLAMWLARRSPTKAIDPGLLDNLVGGGIAAATAVLDTVRKEAWEEAGIAATVAARARPQGSVDICRAQPEGLQRETVFVYDLELDADFGPANQDGEAVEHRQLDDVRRGETDRRRRGPRRQSRRTPAWSSSTACFATARCDRIAPTFARCRHSARDARAAASAKRSRRLAGRRAVRRLRGA
mgnify:CR=1 FL=1